MASLISFHNKNSEFLKILNNNNNNHKFIINYYNKHKYLIILNEDIFNHSLKNNSINICKFILKNINTKNINFKNTLNYLSTIGNLNKFKWLINLYKNINYNLLNCIYNSIQYNHNELTKYILSIFDINDKKSLNLHKIMKIICYNGNEELFNVFYNEFNNINFYSEDYIYFFNSCLSNNINLVDKIYNLSFDINIYHNGFYILDECILYGKYEIFCWLMKHQNSYYYFNLKKYDYFEKACLSDNLLLIKKIYSLINDKSSINFLKIIIQMCGLQKNDSILFLEELSNIDLLNDSLLIIKSCLYNNHYNLMIYIMDKYKILNNEFKNAFQNLINQKMFNILINLNENQLIIFINFIKNNNINIHISDNYLYYIVSNNDINTVKTLFKYLKNNINYNNDILLKKSIQSKNMPKIKYIYYKILKKNINDIDDILDFTILNSTYCIYNYFKYPDYIPKDLNNILIKLIIKDDYKLFTNLFNKCKQKNNINFLKTSVKYNKSNFIIYLLDYININELDNEIIEDIIINCDVNILNLLKNKNYNFSNIDTNILCYINFSYNTDFLKWILNLNLNLHKIKNKLFYKLIKNNNFNNAITLYNNVKNINLKYNENELLRHVCHNGNLYMIKWFIHRIKKFNIIKNTYFFKNIINGNNYSVFKYFINDHKNIEEYYINYYLYYAFNKNYVNICNYLLNLNYNINISFNLLSKYDEACIKLDYNMIDIIFKLTNNYNSYNNINLLLYCVINNFFDILKYIYYTKKYNDNNINFLFINTCLIGNVKIAKWIYNNFDNIDKSIINTDNFLKLCRTFNIDMIDWFYNLNTNIDLSYDNCYILKSFLTMNKYNLVNWVLYQNKVDLSIDNFIFYKICCFNDNLDLLKLLYSYNNIIDFKIDYSYFFKTSSSSNNYYLFKWIYYKTDEINLTEYNYLYFKNAILFDNINFLIFLIDKSNINNLNFCSNYLIRTLINYRYMDTLKYILSIYKNIDVTFDSNYLIKYLVEENDLETIKIIYDYNNNIDLSLNNEYLFIKACQNNNLYLVKWLMDKKKNINISIFDDFVFFQVCKNNYVNIANYLKTLKNNYFEFDIVNNSNNNFIIKNYKVNRNLIIEKTMIVNDKETCPICYDNISDIITYCKHQFCKECMIKIYQKNYNFTCPICRSDKFILYNI